MTSLSAEQEQTMNLRKDPPGWNATNPSYNPTPYPWFNSYTSPAYGTQSGSGLNDPVNNQFTSAVTQPVNHNPVATQFNPAARPVSYLASNQKGTGILEDIGLKKPPFLGNPNFLGKPFHYGRKTPLIQVQKPVTIGAGKKKKHKKRT